jgi:hypothetical protein
MHVSWHDGTARRNQFYYIKLLVQFDLNQGQILDICSSGSEPEMASE